VHPVTRNGALVTRFGSPVTRFGSPVTRFLTRFFSSNSDTSETETPGATLRDMIEIEPLGTMNTPRNTTAEMVDRADRNCSCGRSSCMSALIIFYAEAGAIFSETSGSDAGEISSDSPMSDSSTSFLCSSSWMA